MGRPESLKPDGVLPYFMQISNLGPLRIMEKWEELQSICTKLDKINLDNCNLGSNDERDEYETDLLRIALILVEDLGCKLHHNTDPNGPAIRLIRPDHKSNGTDGETWYL